MIPEIKLLHEKFSGELWNKSIQEQFIDELAQSSFFEGKGSPSDKAFSARDRINRAPKALGFIDLKPNIELTDAGKALIYGKRPQEIFLRQLLKFQLPSPYHAENQKIAGTFYVRPYLEILRLIRELEYITFDEFKIFAVQITDYHKFDAVKADILQFRKEKAQNKGQYKRFVNEVWERAILNIHSDRIMAGKTKTRDSRRRFLKRFKTYLVESNEGAPRKYYQMTEKGFIYYLSLREEWDAFIGGVYHIINQGGKKNDEIFRRFKERTNEEKC
ncbi:MAG: AlwI family type II restriction endonuclease [Erysipelotrichia bacterium]|nr:AlwI family type II restriction endonuclease [Erysipelotrichia bacterium]